jgi:hypothetical protein
MLSRFNAIVHEKVNTYDNNPNIIPISKPYGFSCNTRMFIFRVRLLRNKVINTQNTNIVNSKVISINNLSII